MPTKRAALIVIDGWGEREEEYGNCIKQASTPVMDDLKANGNFAVMEASGLAVGLPEGTMGNSEVGHLTIGAGIVVVTVEIGYSPRAMLLRSFQDLVKDQPGRRERLDRTGSLHAHACNLMVASSLRASQPYIHLRGPTSWPDVHRLHHCADDGAGRRI